MKLSVLLVDDDADDLLTLASAIEMLNLPVKLLYARDCDTLDHYLKTEKNINLILLDINMPIKNGLQCLKEIKTNVNYQHIPVIIFTVSLREKDIEEAFKNYAHYYVVKPYARINFNQTIGKLFSIDWSKPQPQPSKDNFVINLAFNPLKYQGRILIHYTYWVRIASQLR